MNNHVVFVDYLMITPDTDSANNGPWKWGLQVDNSGGWETTGAPTTFAALPASISFVLPRDSWVEARAYGSVYASPTRDTNENHIRMRISVDADTEVGNGRKDHSTVMNAAAIWHTAFATGRWVKLTAGFHTAVLQGYVTPAGSNVRFDQNDAITMMIDATPLP